MLKSAKEVSGSFLTERQILNIILGYADLAQLDTLPAGGVQMATEQSEALSHLLSIRRCKRQFGIGFLLLNMYVSVAQLDCDSGS